MSQSLNVVALISGGKDSLFSLLHCIHHGHKLVALANLYPPSLSSSSYPHTDVLSNPVSAKQTDRVEGEDLNSFMYQTVGHTVISLYADALELPLYRQPIHGKAVDQNRDYSYVSQSLDPPKMSEVPEGARDETEDLTILLRRIKLDHPEANAVSTGAILSTYQRTRVESVAARLNLTCLSYLWQYPLLPPPPERQDSVTGLLDDIEAAGCDARLIKIASAGIKNSLLFRRVSEPEVRQILVTGLRRFVEAGTGDNLELRGSVLGEGGEYETLSLDGPKRLWRKRILVDETVNRVIREEGEVTRIEVGAAVVESHSEYSLDKTEEAAVRIPGLLDDKFLKIQENILASHDDDDKSIFSQPDNHLWQLPQLLEYVSESDFATSFHNLTDPDLSSTIESQTISILKFLDEEIQGYRGGKRRLPIVNRIVFTLVLLRDMGDFAAFNTAYSKYFSQTNPPARVTVCCGNSLPNGTLLSMSAYAVKLHSGQIDGLHVQSISYWTPANIGPYSQAIGYPIQPSDEKVERLVHMAGQIPLIPSTMQISDRPFSEQAVLSLQHLWRVGQSVQVDWWAHGIAYLRDSTEQTVAQRARTAWKVWEQGLLPSLFNCDADSDSMEENDGDFDIWDAKFNHKASTERPLPRTKEAEQAHLKLIPDPSVLSEASKVGGQSRNIPPFLAAHVSSLPRSAPIEWHSLGLARLPQPPQQASRLTVRKESAKGFRIASSWLSDSNSPDSIILEVFWVQIAYSTVPASAHVGHQTAQDLPKALSRLECLRPSWPESSTNSSPLANVDLVVYVCSQPGYDSLLSNRLLPVGKEPRTGIGSTIIPCQSLWGANGERLEMAILGIRQTSRLE